jgi:hypothetical protein
LHYLCVDPIRLVYNVMDGAVIALGVPLNLLMLVLIRTKTPKEMRMYSRLLLISALMDLSVACVTSIVGAVKNE